MPDRDWDAELKKLDRQLESISDKALLPSAKHATAAQQAAVAEQRRKTTTLGVFARLLLVVLLGVGMLFWPYDARCGAGLAGYLAATAVVAVGGVWSAVWTWRHRAARAHIVSLVFALWGVLLAAAEILPRVGYARPTADRPAAWRCPAPTPTAPAPTAPAPTTPAPTTPPPAAPAPGAPAR